jgi:tetratricopeptide (TPR) repeat protein
LQGTPAANLAALLIFRHEFARAESVLAQVYSRPDRNSGLLEEYIVSLMNQGKVRQADSIARIYRDTFPNFAFGRLLAAMVACGSRRFVACDAQMDSVGSALPVYARNTAGWRAAAAIFQGQVNRAYTIEPRLNSPAARWADFGNAVFEDLRVMRRPDLALAGLGKVNPDSITLLSWLPIATAFAEAGRPAEARRWVEKWDQAAPESTWMSQDYSIRMRAQGSIAQAERRWRDAITAWTESDLSRRDHKPITLCTQCMSAGIAAAYDSLRMIDSAIVWYERFLSTPGFTTTAINWQAAQREPATHERLGQLYAAQHDISRAVEHYRAFVQLWDRADVNLQPRVRAARDALAQLGARTPP